MPPRFRDLVHDTVSEDFQWPSNAAFGNALKYLGEQYIDNVKTNIRTHCKARLGMFFKMSVYALNDSIIQDPNAANLFSNDDVKNAINFTYNHRDTTGGDANKQQRLDVLLDELIDCGAPHDCNIRDFVENDWFKSLCMWLQIQRAVQHFHLAYENYYNSWNLFKKYPLYVQRPNIPHPPKIHNFTAIPVCSFQRKHIRIDTNVLYNVLCATNQVPQKLGRRRPWINIKENEFRRNLTGSWGLFFDIEKITKMVKGKKAFDHQILSDGVSVTVLYLRTIQPQTEKSNEELLRLYEAGSFCYELGIDPGMRTWNATVRKNIHTNAEVS